MSDNPSRIPSEREPKKENRHSATSKEQCQKMALLNSWTLIRVEMTGDTTLKVDCIFEGEQTSFMKDY